MRTHIQELLTRYTLEIAGFSAISSLKPFLPGRAAARVPPGTQSALILAIPYYTGDFPGRNIARYAVCDDYHVTVGNILRNICGELSGMLPTHLFAPFVDTSPIREVPAAYAAGLGVVGRHGMLITPKYGAYVFIGEILTTLELAPSVPTPGGCLNCGACLAACPTGALSPDKPFRYELCRSAITQKKGALTAWELDQIRAGGMAWGCDICLDACPMNAGAAKTPLSALAANPAPLVTTGNLDALLPSKAWGWRGASVLRRNLDIIR